MYLQCLLLASKALSNVSKSGLSKKGGDIEESKKTDEGCDETEDCDESETHDETKTSKKPSKKPMKGITVSSKEVNSERLLDIGSCSPGLKYEICR